MKCSTADWQPISEWWLDIQSPRDPSNFKENAPKAARIPEEQTAWVLGGTLEHH